MFVIHSNCKDTFVSRAGHITYKHSTKCAAVSVDISSSISWPQIRWHIGQHCLPLLTAEQDTSLLLLESVLQYQLKLFQKDVC